MMNKGIAWALLAAAARAASTQQPVDLFFAIDAACIVVASRAHAMPLFIIGAGAWLRRLRAEAAPLIFGALSRRAQRFFAVVRRAHA